MSEPSEDLTAYVNDLMDASSIPDSWDDDASADDILKRYFLELERRVVALGGSLEAWPEEDDDGNPLRCPTCTSREPRLHPAAGDGGEVTALCPDAFHKVMPSLYGIRGHAVITREQVEAARKMLADLPPISRDRLGELGLLEDKLPVPEIEFRRIPFQEEPQPPLPGAKFHLTDEQIKALGLPGGPHGKDA